MEAAQFLSTEEGAFGRQLGIRFLTTEPRRVVAEVGIAADGGGAKVSPGLVMGLADTATTYGALLNAATGFHTKTIEAKAIYLQEGRGSLLRAEASPIHLGDAVSVWRAGIYRGESQVAEVTQTHVVLPRGDEKSEASAQGNPADKTRPFGRPSISGGFSDEVVQDRLAQIFDAACIVVAERGFAKASIRQIAEQADMPVATLYQYVEKKDDLLRMIYEYFSRAMSQEIDKVSELRLAPRQALEQLVRRIMDLFDQQERSIRIIFQETRSLSREDRRRVFDSEGQRIASIERFLAAGIESEGWRIDRPELVANFIWFLCSIWPLRHWALRQHGMDLVVDTLVDFIMRGIGAGSNARAPSRK